jgi:hypothetical protein
MTLMTLRILSIFAASLCLGMHTDFLDAWEKCSYRLEDKLFKVDHQKKTLN